MLRDGIDPYTGFGIGHKDARLKKAPGLAERNRIEEEWK